MGPAKRSALQASDIKAFREQHGLTQAQLGEELGVPRSTVAHWERGGHIPKLLPVALRGVYYLRRLRASSRRTNARVRAIENALRSEQREEAIRAAGLEGKLQ